MRSIRQVIVESGIKIDSVQEQVLIEAIRQYAVEVVEECAGSAEYTMEYEGLYPDSTDVARPVLIRSSIQDVINKIV